MFSRGISASKPVASGPLIARRNHTILDVKAFSLRSRGFAVRGEHVPESEPATPAGTLVQNTSSTITLENDSSGAIQNDG